uniref:Cytochrome P450 n=1 Tax=Cannabis sativa TaxID=3483 RepID=A0A803Q7X8_CANSA
MYLEIGQVPTIVVSSAEYAEEVMRTHDVVFASRPQMLVGKIMSYDFSGIAFSPYALTYNIISRAAFGKKSGDHEEFVLISKEALKDFGAFEVGEFFPFLSFLDKWIKGAKYERLQLKASKILENIMEEHIKENNEKSLSSMSSTSSSSLSIVKSGKEEDLVDVLLKFHNNGDLGEFNLTKNNIKAVIMDIFIGGSETSSVTLDWAMAEMMRNPRVMKKAQDEVRKVVKKNGSIMNEGLLNEMKYLKSVVKETLRLHPPGALVPRECRENCEINGYQIPKKTRLIVNLWAIGRDPKYWIEPENFMPERFIESSIEFKGGNFEYIPFGAGRRICPGISFGLINVELPLAYLLYHFNWNLPNKMNHENLDMTEFVGASVSRRDDLYLIPSINSF